MWGQINIKQIDSREAKATCAIQANIKKMIMLRYVRRIFIAGFRYIWMPNIGNLKDEIVIISLLGDRVERRSIRLAFLYININAYY
jgi:hypothetical protein